MVWNKTEKKKRLRFFFYLKKKKKKNLFHSLKTTSEKQRVCVCAKNCLTKGSLFLRWLHLRRAAPNQIKASALHIKIFSSLSSFPFFVCEKFSLSFFRLFVAAMAVKVARAGPRRQSSAGCLASWLPACRGRSLQVFFFFNSFDIFINRRFCKVGRMEELVKDILFVMS